MLYKTLCQPLSNELHKMPIYGQTLSKQGRGTDKLRPMHVEYSINVNTNGVRKEKGSCNEPTSHKKTRSTYVACFTTSRGNEVYGSV